MHLLIPFAGPLSAAGRQALPSLALPQLQNLLACLGASERDEGDEWSLSPPHERALARALGLAGADGRLPWAAWLARADGRDTADLAWGLLTPVHLHVGSDQISLLDPAALALDDTTSRALFDAVQELFTSEGVALLYGAPLRWYAAHESLAGLACASVDRVIGRSVDPWLTDDPAVRLLRRLQNEVQMLLYTHPINDRREAQGELSVNSFWLSGCGLAAAAAAPPPTVDERLRAPALAGDWAAWVEAWHSLDAGPLAALAAAARRGAPARLTLCGERSSVTLAAAPGGWWRELQARWRRPNAHALLETL